MSEIQDALKLLAENGYAVTPPRDKIIYLVDHGKGIPMTTRRTLNPTKGWNNKTGAQRVALLYLEELEWIVFEEVDFNKGEEQ